MSVNSLVNFGVPGQSGERSAVLQPILTNRFRVVTYNFGTPGVVAPYDITRNVLQLARPTYTFSEIPLHSYLSTVYIAGKVEFGATKMRLSDDIDNTSSNIVQMQLNKQQNFFDQTASRAGQNYKFEMDLDILAGGASAGSSTDANIITKYSFVGCWLTNVDFGEMNYDTTERAVINMNIRFDNCITLDQNGNIQGQFDMSPQIDGRIGDFSTGIGGLL